MGVYDVDKAQLMELVLRRHHVPVRWRQGWQSISCPIKHAHTHGDKNKSASLNMSIGRINCHGCGFSGDGYDLMEALEGLDAKQTAEIFDGGIQSPVQSSASTFTFARRDTGES